MNNFRFLLAILFLIAEATFARADIDYFSAENLVKFADYLYDQKDYSRAAGEYERFLIAYPDSVTPYVYQRLLGCYEQANKLDTALKTIERIPDRFKGTDCSWFYHQTRLKFLIDNQTDIPVLLTERTTCLNDTTRLLLTAYYLKNHQFKQAALTLDTMYPDLIGRSEFTDLISQANHLPRKSPALAAAMSAVVPGSGKLYLGRSVDALMSFATSGLLLWLAYDHLANEGSDSRSGWVYLGLGSVFYFGNVYGSYKAAKIYNYQQQKDMDLKIEMAIHLYLK